ncbi:MAG: C39 family peptidase [Akkermansiaceae bacterium]
MSTPILVAIPNQIIGGVNAAASPLNGVDITDEILADDVWSGAQKIRGKWREEAQIAEAQVSHLLARPKVLGLDAILIRATERDGSLESVSITYADAGSYFPYLQRKKGMTLEQLRKEVLERQQAFYKLYRERRNLLIDELQSRSKRKAKLVRYGSTRTLRAEVQVYRIGDIYAALLSDNHRLLRVTFSKDASLFRKTWLDSSRAKLSAREQSAFYQDQVKKTANGDQWIPSISTVPQGYRPYCGLNSLAMAAQYFGLHIDEDWMAVAGKFQNTGSAAGSNMLSLYNATASEAKLALTRETKFSYAKARGLLRSGMPIVVWRRFDSGRNTLHSQFARRYLKDKSLTLPLANQQDRASWPGEKHPVHASVIVGFNDERKEVLFLESWAGQSIPRRMRYEELEATATMVFYFKGK